MNKLVNRSVPGLPPGTSLCDLGYCDAVRAALAAKFCCFAPLLHVLKKIVPQGLDDAYQLCSEPTPSSPFTFHNSDGYIVIDKSKFPDLSSMTSHAHSLGLTAGWYLNNCLCTESDPRAGGFIAQEMEQFRSFGFDGLKVDGCGPEKNMTQFYSLMPDGGSFENCWNGAHLWFP